LPKLCRSSVARDLFAKQLFAPGRFQLDKLAGEVLGVVSSRIPARPGGAESPRAKPNAKSERFIAIITT